MRKSFSSSVYAEWTVYAVQLVSPSENNATAENKTRQSLVIRCQPLIQNVNDTHWPQDYWGPANDASISATHCYRLPAFIIVTLYWSRQAHAQLEMQLRKYVRLQFLKHSSRNPSSHVRWNQQLIDGLQKPFCSIGYTGMHTWSNARSKRWLKCLPQSKPTL